MYASMIRSFSRPFTGLFRRNHSSLAIKPHGHFSRNKDLHSAGSIMVRDHVVPLPPNPIVPIATPKNVNAWGEDAVLFPPDDHPFHREVSLSTELYLELRPALYRAMEGVWVLSHFRNGLSFFSDEFSAHAYGEALGIGHECVCYCLGREIDEVIRIRSRASKSPQNTEECADPIKLRYFDGIFEENEIKVTTSSEFRVVDPTTNGITYLNFDNIMIVDTGTSHSLLSVPKQDLKQFGVTFTAHTQTPLSPIKKASAAIALINFGGIKTLTKCILVLDDFHSESLLGMSVLSRLDWSFSLSKDIPFTVDGTGAGVDSHSWNNKDIDVNYCEYD